MATRTIIRGDSYGYRRPFYTHTFVDSENKPMHLHGCTIISTYKSTPTDPFTDPTDDDAVIKHHIKILPNGAVDSNTNMFMKDNDPRLGIVYEYLTSSESMTLPVGVPMYNDVVLIDLRDERATWLMSDTLVAVSGYTNRTV